MVPALSAQQQQRRRFYRGYVPLKRVTCAFPRLNVFMFVSVPPPGCVFCHFDEVSWKVRPYLPSASQNTSSKTLYHASVRSHNARRKIEIDTISFSLFKGTVMLKSLE